MGRTHACAAGTSSRTSLLSLRGLSHTKLGVTKPEHLELAVQALARLVRKTTARYA